MLTGKNRTDRTSGLQRDKTSASMYGFGGEDRPVDEEQPDGFKMSYPTVYAYPASSHTGIPPSTMVSDPKVNSAWQASATLQCTSLIDGCLVAVSALAYPSNLGLIYLCAALLAMLGRLSAKFYRVDCPFIAYVGYCIVTAIGRIGIAVWFGTLSLYYEMALEIVKVFAQLWFLWVAVEYFCAIRKVTPDQIKWLRGGRIAICSAEMLMRV